MCMCVLYGCQAVWMCCMTTLYNGAAWLQTAPYKGAAWLQTALYNYKGAVWLQNDLAVCDCML